MDDSEVVSAVPEPAPALASSVAVPSVSLPQVLIPTLSEVSVLGAGASTVESLELPKVEPVSVAIAVEPEQTDLVETGLAEVRPREPSSIDKQCINRLNRQRGRRPLQKLLLLPNRLI
jgi:hypothetical protein